MHVQTTGISTSSYLLSPVPTNRSFSNQKRFNEWSEDGGFGEPYCEFPINRQRPENASCLSKGTAAGLTQNCGKLCAYSSSASLLKHQSQLLSDLGSAWTRNSQTVPGVQKKVEIQQLALPFPLSGSQPFVLEGILEGITCTHKARSTWALLTHYYQ